MADTGDSLEARPATTPLEQLDRERRDRVEQHHQGRLAWMRLRLQQLGEQRLPDTGLGSPEPATALNLHHQLTLTITGDIALGRTRHRRLPWGVRQVPRIVALIDGV